MTDTAPTTAPTGPAPLTPPPETPTDTASTAPEPSKRPYRPKGVVATSELRAHTVDGPSDDPAAAPMSDSPPTGGAVDDGLTAEHWHEPGNGPAWTPAGAHRHTPDGPVHIHMAAPVVPTSDQRPRPWDDDLNPPPDGGSSDGKWVAAADFQAVVNHQVVQFHRGQPIDGQIGRYLADTGAPVSGTDAGGETVNP